MFMIFLISRINITSISCLSQAILQKNYRSARSINTIIDYKFLNSKYLRLGPLYIFQTLPLEMEMDTVHAGK